MEELKKLLKSSNISAATKRDSDPADSSERDLASLIGSVQKDISRGKRVNELSKTPVHQTIDSRHSNSATYPLSPSQSLQFNVLRFGARLSLRGSNAKYITAIPTCDTGEPLEESSFSLTSSANTKLIFPVGVEGQGIGEDVDCLEFVNMESRDYTGPVMYGSLLAIRAPAAKERLLGIKEGEKLGFWRNLAGQGERWTILKAASTKGLEEPGTRGSPVHIGDLILLQCGEVVAPPLSSDTLGGSGGSILAPTPPDVLGLSEIDTGRGHEPILVPNNRAGLWGETWQVELFGTPPLPLWHNRPYLSGSFILERRNLASLEDFSGLALQRHLSPASISASAAAKPSPLLGTLSTEVQHAVLVRELLLALAGIEGQYIRIAAPPTTPPAIDDAGLVTSPPGPPPALKSVKLVIEDSSGDRSAVSQISGLLPLCEHAVQVRMFVRKHSRHDFGLVSHSLAAALREMVREFDVLTAQLEALLTKVGGLSIQKLVFLLHPANVVFRLLSELCRRVDDSAGGKMIDVLHRCLLEQGDAKARDLCAKLLNKAAVPFLEMLERWIFRGELKDVYKEFFIAENTAVSREALASDFNAQYWEEHFTLRESHVPSLLRAHAAKALTTGKYITVVSGCLASSLLSSSGSAESTAVFALRDESTDMSKLRLESDAATTIPRFIEHAYTHSSRALLKLLEEQYALSSHLRSLMRFFLLEHGDFFIQLMDTAETELRRDVASISISRIQVLLQLAVQTSTLSADPHRDELSCTLESHNLIQHLQLIQSAGSGSVGGAGGVPASIQQGLKGVEAFTLNYRVGWPLSIILSRRAITKYQLLSRLLYFSKYVELRVLGSWQEHQRTKSLEVRECMGPFLCLRHRMLHFLQNFVYYMTLEVIGPRGHEMKSCLAAAQDMDEVLEFHEKFLDSCLKECLLASHDLLNTLTKIMATCLVFADHVRTFAEASQAAGNAGVEPAIPRSERGGAKARAAAGAGFPKSEEDENVARGEALRAQRGVRQRALDRQTAYILEESRHQTFGKYLTTFESKFDKEVGDFLEKLFKDSHRNQPQLANLCVRLDYNGYYSKKFATAAVSSVSA